MMDMQRKFVVLLIGITIGVFSGCVTGQQMAKGDSLHEEMIVFEDKATGAHNLNRPRIMISRADGSDRQILMKDAAHPKWFPSGDRILVFVPEYDRGWLIGSYDINGHVQPPGKSVIINLEGQIQQELPYRVTDVSSDGSHLLVVKYTPKIVVGAYGLSRPTDPGGKEIAIYDLKTNSLQKVIALEDLPREWNVKSLMNAQWFPEGERICFQLGKSARATNQIVQRFPYSALGTIRSDGTALKLLTEFPRESRDHWYWGPREFAISPDGKKIVYIRNINEEEKISLDSQVYVMNADGTEPRQLTKGGRGVFGIGWKSFKSSPVWSPDGTKILYTDDQFPQNESHLGNMLMMMNADGTGAKRVMPGGWRHMLPFAFELDIHADWWAPPAQDGRRSGRPP